MKKMAWFRVLTFRVGAGCGSLAFAQTPSSQSLVGDWSGALTVGGSSLPLVIHLRTEAGEPRS